MQNMQEYKCPCCGGAIAFDSTIQKMKCPYCDSEFEMETLQAMDEQLKEGKSDSMEWETKAGGEWHIHTFNLINMILVFENLRQKTLPGNMFHQSFFGCFLVQLKWDNQIRPECTCKFSRENNRIVTKRTLGCRHRCISDDFSTAGLADIGT